MVGTLHCSVAALVLRDKLCTGRAVIDGVRKIRADAMMYKDNIVLAVAVDSW
jgi:hypothetical protein